MNLIIESTLNTLQKSKSLLSVLSDEQLSNSSVSPYYSCVGSHIRHVLDFYNCIFDGLQRDRIDLTARTRDLNVEKDCNYALEHVEIIVEKIERLSTITSNTKLVVIDDLGLGNIEIEYTLGALLAQANSHAIHHYAIISYVLDRLGIYVEDETFGYNPSTPIIPAANLN